MIVVGVLALGAVITAMILMQRQGFASVFPSEWFGAGLDTPGGYVPTLTGSFLPEDEIERILNTAASVGIDARLLAAIRKAENGGPGREFGIVSIPAPTYDLQAKYAANTIRNNQARYEAETGFSATNGGGRFTDAFITYLGSKYAPIGVSNDPTGLNRNWVGNVTTYYRSIDYA